MLGYIIITIMIIVSVSFLFWFRMMCIEFKRRETEERESFEELANLLYELLEGEKNGQ